jgi:hypothetical protein
MPRRAEPGERTCIVTRLAKPTDALIRFVVAPDGSVVPDIRRRLPGRGVWVTADAEHVRAAARKRLLARAFHGPANVDDGIADEVERLLASAAISALSLARKAGTMVGGHAKVAAAIGHDPVIALVHAAEAGADGVDKLQAAARRRYGEEKLPVIRCFASGQLDLAFGRTNVIHAALLAGPASDNALARVRDLVRYRGDEARMAGAGGFRPTPALS